MTLLESLCALAVVAILASLAIPTVIRTGQKLAWQASWTAIYHNSEINEAIEDRPFYDENRSAYRAILKW